MTPSGEGLSSIVGTGFDAAHRNTVLATRAPSNWYYAACSYTYDPASNRTTFASYVADLTAGQTRLTSVGPITVAGSYPLSPEKFGIGGRYDGLSVFPGSIDEVNQYGGALSKTDFQKHLDLLQTGSIRMPTGTILAIR